MVDSRRIGIAFSGGANPSEIVDCVRLAESLGYESAWVAEGHGGDQFAVLAACAAETSRILLGTSITSVFVRTAPTIAMADLSGGRFMLGVGSSHKVQVEGDWFHSRASCSIRIKSSSSSAYVSPPGRLLAGSALHEQRRSSARLRQISMMRYSGSSG